MNRVESSGAADSGAAAMADLLTIRQATKGTLGGLSIGVVSVAGRSLFGKGKALLELSWRDQPWSARIAVEPGTLLPVPGGFHRVMEIKADAVSITGAPEQPAGLSPGQGVFLFLGETAICAGEGVVVEEIGAGGGARLVTWDTRKGTHDNEHAERTGITKRIAIASGDLVTLGGREQRVAAIVPPDGVRGVVGWIELSSP
jgi:hypothetical protein